MSQELKHNHAGHRQRLKDKVRKTRLTTLAEHEIIELLLTYTIPRKDTNPIAHELLKTFSSIDRVIDANVRDLQKVNGVGEETALFFKILSQLFGVYRQSKENYKDKLLTTQQSHSHSGGTGAFAPCRCGYRNAAGYCVCCKVQLT